MISRLEYLHLILVRPYYSDIDTTSRRYVVSRLMIGLVYLFYVNLYRRIVFGLLILSVAVLFAITTNCCCLNNWFDL